MKENNGSGIYILSGGYNSIFDSTISHNDLDGIICDNSEYNIIYRNLIENNLAIGCNLSNSCENNSGFVA